MWHWSGGVATSASPVKDRAFAQSKTQLLPSQKQALLF